MYIEYVSTKRGNISYSDSNEGWFSECNIDAVTKATWFEGDKKSFGTKTFNQK